MKNWNESEELLRELAAVLDRGGRAALATVVTVDGSSYRRPGAKLLIREDGSLSGNVSGGCLEGDVREQALGALRDGTPRLIEYRTGDDEDQLWGLGLGCNGRLEIFVAPYPLRGTRESVGAILDCLAGDASFAVTTIVASNGDDVGDVGIAASAGQAESGTAMAASRRVFTDVYVPPPDLVVCGADDGAMPLVRYAAEAGFRVTVADGRSGYLTPDRFPAAHRLAACWGADAGGSLPRRQTTYVVVRTHSLNRDREWLRYFAETPVPYIGLLGPRERRDELLAELPDGMRPRLYGPAGLDLLGEGHEQVALSILAEVLAVRAGRDPIHLRDRDGRIHDDRA